VLVLQLDPDVEDRNYAKEPLTRAEMTRIVDTVGVAQVLNTRHKVAKEHGWKEKAPAKATFVKAALEEPNLLRRPVLIRGRKAVVGFDEDAIRELLQ
jgi:arsenate reductase-like glutaredoxin family protein